MHTGNLARETPTRKMRTLPSIKRIINLHLHSTSVGRKAPNLHRYQTRNNVHIMAPEYMRTALSDVVTNKENNYVHTSSAWWMPSAEIESDRITFHRNKTIPSSSLSSIKRLLQHPNDNSGLKKIDNG
ncbi:hypothetical protein AVEN_101060-1 [Araneus ventricosus]|uniref:Uncharacterized protein n=1 Tax=Araneus ventricosus TaxID=182803 RepID=A0A4Y2FVV4_ARAVE|nr:hypothetical protein AVEN_101060-1 [Araneus ventricosus]